MKNKVKYRLSEIRSSKNMTQQEIATKLGIGVSTYNMYENGVRMIPVDIAYRITEILKVNIDDIFLPTKFTISKNKV